MFTVPEKPEFATDFFGQWIMAWRKLDFSFLGMSAWDVSDHGKYRAAVSGTSYEEMEYG